MTTHPEWNQETGGLEVAKAFSDQIQGRNVLITGVSPESIGSSTAIAVASQSPSVLILASRTQSKLDEVVKKIKEDYPSVNVQTVLLDLASQEAVKKAAAEISSITNKLDLIINNAAVMTPTLQHTAEGIEAQFGSNHIGHFLLTNLLLPSLYAAAKSSPPGATRVVNLTSLGHRLSPVRFHDYNFEGKEIPDEEKFPGKTLPPIFQGKNGSVYNGYIAYGQAKTANVLFSLSLTERLRDQGIVSYAVHPGSIWTGLSRNLDAEGEEAIRKTSPFWKNHDQGAATTIVAAFDPALNQSQGLLLHDCQFTDAAPHANDPKLAENLWALSEKLVKRDFKL
ncbi:short chain dehydrogenase/ reductase-like protein [Aaosphaeria arxii CBS 175.79]|uniref:Short chain dehydrogenase/ reductase-like protein n=1 Tax=Aaosphaeria arxii CBS 175.79 TaxID=1450172 RepID=A0A6A5XP96_9PLEO|nr:short chain dehydrogenase/ reductase-like protein [Aaosphaeria arxii CBS 175.79]KAF2015068.1 short chain dehydrogenase/ reductase-like protein [Aaosphaeria arxii CBS 175.79]